MDNDFFVREILELNNNCKFNYDVEQDYHFYFNLNNKPNYKRFNMYLALQRSINEEWEKYRAIVQDANQNYRMHQSYIKECFRIKERYNAEHSLLMQYLLKDPVIEPNFHIHCSYKDSKETLSKTQTFNFFEVKHILPYPAFNSEERMLMLEAERNLNNHITTKTVIYNNFAIIDELSPFEFEDWLSSFFNSCGYKAFTTRRSGDFGADVIVEMDGKRIAIQAKKHKNELGTKCVQEILAGMSYYRADEGWVMSTAPDFTNQAKELAKNTNVKLFNINGLIIFINSLYR